MLLYYTRTMSAAPPIAAGSPTSGATHVRILFVDDDPRVVQMTYRALRACGHGVVALTSSTEALERFRADPEPFDLLITDQHMPDLNGDALARELHSLRPDLPVIVCSGLLDSATHELGADLGVCEFLSKPLALEDLSRAIERVLGREAPLASRLQLERDVTKLRT